MVDAAERREPLDPVMVLDRRRAQILSETGIDVLDDETVRRISRGELRESCVRAGAAGVGVTCLLAGVGLLGLSVVLGGVLVLLGVGALGRAARRGRRWQREVAPLRAARRAYIGEDGGLSLLAQSGLLTQVRPPPPPPHTG